MEAIPANQTPNSHPPICPSSLDFYRKALVPRVTACQAQSSIPHEVGGGGGALLSPTDPRESLLKMQVAGIIWSHISRHSRVVGFAWMGARCEFRLWTDLLPSHLTPFPFTIFVVLHQLKTFQRIL
jgi:hypothetical protein